MKSLAQAPGRRITPGDLTALIDFERETRTADGYAGATNAWTFALDAWAAVEPLFVGEREQQGSVRNVVQYRFVVYASDEISEQMRIVHEAKTYNIRGIRRGGPSELFMDVIAETGLGD